MGAEPNEDAQALRGQALKLLDQHGDAFTLGSAEDGRWTCPSRALAADANPAGAVAVRPGAGAGTMTRPPGRPSAPWT